jgi:hypothetical protein
LELGGEVATRRGANVRAGERDPHAPDLGEHDLCVSGDIDVAVGESDDELVANRPVAEQRDGEAPSKVELTVTPPATVIVGDIGIGS